MSLITCFASLIVKFRKIQPTTIFDEATVTLLCSLRYLPYSIFLFYDMMRFASVRYSIRVSFLHFHYHEAAETKFRETICHFQWPLKALTDEVFSLILVTSVRDGTNLWLVFANQMKNKNTVASTVPWREIL